MKKFLKALGISMFKVFKDAFFVGVGVGCTVIGIDMFKKDAGIKNESSTNIIVLKDNDSKNNAQTQETK